MDDSADSQRALTLLWQHNALSFGASGSVWGFNRFADLLQFIARKILWIPVHHYVDDFAAAEDERLAESGFTAFADLYNGLGLKVKEKKAQPPAAHQSSSVSSSTSRINMISSNHVQTEWPDYPTWSKRSYTTTFCPSMRPRSCVANSTSYRQLALAKSAEPFCYCSMEEHTHRTSMDLNSLTVLWLLHWRHCSLRCRRCNPASSRSLQTIRVLLSTPMPSSSWRPTDQAYRKDSREDVETFNHQVSNAWGL